MQQALSSRAALPAPLRAQARGAAAVRAPLLVVASKKVTKKAQVVLTEDVPNLGAQGLLTSVRLGYFRCGLPPACRAPRASRSSKCADPAPGCPDSMPHSPARRWGPPPASARFRRMCEQLCDMHATCTGTICCPRAWPSWPTSPSWRRSRRSARLRRPLRARCVLSTLAMLSPGLMPFRLPGA